VANHDPEGGFIRGRGIRQTAQQDQQDGQEKQTQGDAEDGQREPAFVAQRITRDERRDRHDLSWNRLAGKFIEQAWTLPIRQPIR